MSLEEFAGQPAGRFTDNFNLAHEGTLPERIVQELFVRNRFRPVLALDGLLDMSQRAEVVTFQHKSRAVSKEFPRAIRDRAVACWPHPRDVPIAPQGLPPNAPRRRANG